MSAQINGTIKRMSPIKPKPFEGNLLISCTFLLEVNNNKETKDVVYMTAWGSVIDQVEFFYKKQCEVVVECSIVSYKNKYGDWWNTFIKARGICESVPPHITDPSDNFEAYEWRLVSCKQKEATETPETKLIETVTQEESEKALQKKEIELNEEVKNFLDEAIRNDPNFFNRTG